MKKTLLILFAAISVLSLSAQEKEAETKKQWIEFSGHARYEAFMDTYESIEARDGDVYLYPKRAKFDANGDDINEYIRFNMVSAQSRLRAKINGPDAFGAKVNGMFEMDFLGLSADPELTPRIRHLFMNLNWGKTQLLMGYSWHPIFVTECFPMVLGMGAALPFNPLNRAPQIKLTHKLTDNLIVVGALSSYTDFTSKGPLDSKGNPIDIQRNSGIPDIHGQFKYVSKKVAVGIVGGYKVLKPRTVTDANVKTEKTIGSYSVEAFCKLNVVENLTLKLSGIYGENLSSFVMIGGFGAAQDPTSVDDYDYSNIQTMGSWGEIIYKMDAWTLGFFGGYSANLGTSEEGYFKTTSYTRSGNIDNIVRISPRVSYTAGKIMLGLEYMYTSASYIDITAEAWTITNTDPTVANNRIQFSSKYSF